MLLLLPPLLPVLLLVPLPLLLLLLLLLVADRCPLSSPEPASCSRASSPSMSQGPATCGTTLAASPPAPAAALPAPAGSELFAKLLGTCPCLTGPLRRQ